MDDLVYIYAIAAMIVATFILQVMRKTFDPFAPIWLFFVGYAHVYVIQALSYHEWGIRTRGAELVAAASFRSFWAISLFMLVYFLAPCRVMAKCVPRPPKAWSISLMGLLCPVLMVWGLYCAYTVSRLTSGETDMSAESNLILSFPLFLLVSGILLVVSGRLPEKPQPMLVMAGVAIITLYMLLWMFNGKRSHSLIAVLTGVCVFYISKLKRPSFPILIATAILGASSVGAAISWRYYMQKSESKVSFSTFLSFLSDFDPGTVLESLNIKEHAFATEDVTYETEEFGAYLLMMDTVPMKSDYDYGLPYLRVFTTFIPRVVWPSKPLPGRDQWTEAWIAGSEQKRDMTFTGPAISILGATQLNGGAMGTFIVIGVVAFVLRAGYEYFRMHADVPWVQVWWALTYYNAWFCTVNDDPLNWFYYNWGFTTMPMLVALWVANKFSGAPANTAAPAPSAVAAY
ncbi:hypothetical protein TA3x_002769 [Tundrisphaera sp. TA3]|uniref:hypothetical protein n=1 Tax=Tundrisphaera sp. TA3 TaxID=3435775 RepID=UPI003EB6B207